ncbi:MAG: hypothetical protein ACHQQQ_13060 [Bacteroidota bacterium]
MFTHILRPPLHAGFPARTTQSGRPSSSEEGRQGALVVENVPCHGMIHDIHGTPEPLPK